MTTDIQSALERAAENLGSGLLTSEAQVSHSVIVPILRALDWDSTNPAELVPEYSVPGYTEGQGRVDFALLKTGRPLVFIEAKKPNGLSDAGVSQLFNYANNQGVPLLVLTDGSEWRFYLSMAAGLPDERRFYRAELYGGEKISEIARHFDLYLSKNQVHSGNARRVAEDFHTNTQSKVEAKNLIPEVWLSLLQEPDDTLRDLLIEVVEKKCGTRPDFDDVSEFLDKQVQNIMTANTSAVFTKKHSSTISPSSYRSDTTSRRRSQIIGYTINGKRCESGTARRTLAEVLIELHQRDPNDFMVKYAHATRTRTRRLVAQSQEDLYDKKDLIRNHSMRLEGGWWLGTNLSSGDIKKNIIKACKIAGIRFGKELTLIELG